MNAGVVHVVYGSMDGILTTIAQLWQQDLPDVGEAVGTGDRFGNSLH